MENSIYVLCILNHSGSKGWIALAAFDHEPTFDDIINLQNFKDKTEFDKAIAKTIEKHQYCGIQFSDNFYDSIEYNVYKAKDNGDLLLWDYLITGYIDCVEKDKIVDVRNFK